MAGATKRSGTSNRGFASMNSEQQKAIARKGGEAVSQNRAHMAAIGRKGGDATHANSRTRQQSSSQNAQHINNVQSILSGPRSQPEGQRPQDEQEQPQQQEQHQPHGAHKDERGPGQS